MNAFLTLTSLLSSATNDTHPMPSSSLDPNEWWGPNELRAYEDTTVQPASIHFDEQMIEDLKDRLRRHVPFRPPLEDAAFTYGFNSNSLEDWITYWAEQYPFKEREAFLNQFPQFRTNIQGLDIHFIWVKPQVPPNKQVVPLLLLHGWPGSIREFYEAIPILTADYPERDFAVEVIVPCLPGFGFSSAAVRPGLGGAQIAVVLRNLMRRLGFERFYVQGGDWGGLIGSFMATLFPQELLGFHTNWGLVISSQALKLLLQGSADPSLIVDPELADRIYPLSEKLAFLAEETGYLHLAATKPDTVGIALTDSPAGLLAFILEKFSTGVSPDNRKLADGGLWRTFTPEQLIDDLMMYWTSKTISTSLRIYAETLNKKHFALKLEATPTTVPTWVIQPKYELTYQPPEILRLKYQNLVNTTVLEFGGHFLALEYPQVFSEDVLTALDTFRQFHMWNESGM